MTEMNVRTLDWPLMHDNITREDLDTLIAYLQQPEPRLTQAGQVVAFEREWSEWVGLKHSVFVNSGSSANELTMLAVRHLKGEGEVIVPPLTWVSDISSVLFAGLQPVFADIDPKTLGMDTDEILRKITPRTRAVFLTHILGYNAITQRLVDELKARGIPLIEDVCESHGATFQGRKCGSIGWASNFSFYYAHHMSTIEGGVVCTDDPELYDILRLLRSHGMTREAATDDSKREWARKHPDLNPDFIFAYPAHNMRSTELNAVIGRNQLKRLDRNNEQRRKNLRLFLAALDSKRYFTDFAEEGSCNYAFTLVLRQPDVALRDRIEAMLRTHKVEFRRGTSGGGNQLRQPYLRRLFPQEKPENYPRVDHVHFYGWYIGNYPGLETEKIAALGRLLNEV